MEKWRAMNKCEYCNCGLGDNVNGRCPNCGGPVQTKAVDYAICPYCSRKLLAMSSLACNYCGKGLPPDYIQMRQNVARTIAEQSRLANSAPDKSFILIDSESDGSLFGSLGRLFRSVED